MRRLVLAAVASVAALGSAAPAGAIVGGNPDGNRHPNVGGLVSPVPGSDGTWIYCSGTLISPTVVLTAAHCAEDGEAVRVTFDPAYEAGDETHTGTFQADPLYNGAQNDPHDIAVVVLDEPITDIAPAKLPKAGSLSKLPKNQVFTSVGYGSTEPVDGPGGKDFVYTDVRRYARGTLNTTNKSWLRISQNASTGNGGTCYGDSGGPNFLGRSSTIASITITGDAVCRATNVTYRLDTASARAFLDDHVDLP